MCYMLAHGNLPQTDKHNGTQHQTHIYTTLTAQPIQMAKHGYKCFRICENYDDYMDIFIHTYIVEYIEGQKDR